MLTSPEEAYTDYLGHVVTDNGIDPAVVHATLRQLGYDDATIAIMMGEAEAPLSSFSSSASSAALLSKAPSSSVQTSAQKVRRTPHTSFFSSSSSSSLAPPQPEFSRSSIKNSDIDSRSASRDAASVAGCVDPVQPAFLPERRSSQVGRTPTNSTSSSTRASFDLTAAAAAHKTDVKTAARESIATPSSESSSSHTRRGSLSQGGPVRSLHEHAARPQSIDSPSCADRLGGAATAGERDVLRSWMREYNALLLSSAMPRRAVDTRRGPTCESPTLMELFDERHRVPTAEAHSVSTEEAEEAEGVRGSAKGKLLPTAYAGVSGGLSSSSSSDGCSGDVNSSTSSSISSGADAGAAHRCYDGSAEAMAHPFALRTAARAEGGRHASCLPVAASSVPFRTTIPKAASAVFVPTLEEAHYSHRCGAGAGARSAASARLTLADGACRHPYREAQDVRIVRASKAVVIETGRARSGRGVSQSRAREVDEARVMQRTSRAEPTTGRRIPVMQPPVQFSVGPRSELAAGGVPTTLPQSARTDRVTLAQYYRREWQRQEQRTTVASRDAVWDTRYALLSRTSAQPSK